MFHEIAQTENSLPECEGKNYTQWTNCFGVEKLKNATYVGEYKNGNFHGQGTLAFNNGEKYIGEFINGMRSGKGTLTWADGGKYVGEFKDDNRNGEGTTTFPSENKYIGQYKKWFRKWTRNSYKSRWNKICWRMERR